MVDASPGNQSQSESMKPPLWIATLFSAAIWVLSSTAHGVVLFQIDDFEDATTEGWANGSVADPANITSGGPLGAGDNYLQITASGSGSGGKLTTYNRSQWIGNFIVAGVTEIEMDLKGFSSPGNANLSIRFAFRTGTGSGAPGYVSTSAFSLPVDGLWHHAVFSLSAMTPVGSPGALNTVLAGPAEARIFHAAAANTVQGDNIVGQFGVDNIRSVPEPSAPCCLALVFGGNLLRRRVTR
jgi:hypothetical protein